MYISEEAVQKAQRDAQAAQASLSALAADRTARGQAAYAEAHARATQLATLAEGMRAGRERQDEARATREATVKRMTPELSRMLTSLQASRDQVQAGADDLARALAKLRTASLSHTNLLTEFGARLSGAGLLASDDLTEPGTHHPSGSNGARGIYLADTEWAPVEGAAVGYALLADAFGDGYALLRYQARAIVANSRLENRPDGFELPQVPATHKTPASA